MEQTNKKRGVLSLWMGFILCLSGLVILFLGLYLPPQGEIHSSVLVAFGEISTFSGGLFGLNYYYQKRDEKSERNG